MAKQKEEVRTFILQNISDHSGDLVRYTAAHFGISRQAVSRHLKNLINENVIIAEGSAKNRKFSLKKVQITHSFVISPALEEDRVWSEYFKPSMPVLPQNINDIIVFGFTEVVNNAIDHSLGNSLEITVLHDEKVISIEILDDGIGIFNNIKEKLHLADPRQAILQLAKGKLTTDPEHHTGEGIFFTSRMFDDFYIVSGGLVFSHNTKRNDMLVDFDLPVKGTMIIMSISRQSTQTAKSIFDQFTNSPDDYSFSKTIIPVRLAQYEGENLISRSQAKRILSRIENFKEVIFDFAEIQSIGRAFADEIFRVYVKAHPEIAISYRNANEQIDQTIQYILNQIK